MNDAMKGVHERPLLWLGLAFIAGVSLGYCISAPLPAIPLVTASALGVVSLVAGLTTRGSVLRLHALALGSFCLLGVTAARLAAPELPAPASLHPFFESPETLYLAQVLSPPTFQSGKPRIPLRLHSAIRAGEAHPIDAGILLTIGQPLDDKCLWLPGDRFLVRLNVKPLRGFENPGGFDYVTYQAEKGIYGRAFLATDRSLIHLEHPQGRGEMVNVAPSGIVRTFEGFRQHARMWLRDRLPEDQADFYGALLLGYPLPSRWNDHLNRTGLSHLLSISGLHLGLVSFGVFWLTCRLVRWGAPRLLRRTSDQQIARWPALFAAILYALLSGLAIPTWRSLIMLGLFTWAVLRYRAPDALTTLACAAVVILLAWPNSIAQVSFQLSFAAMVGLFVVYPGIHRFILLNDRIPTLKKPLPAALIRPFVEAFWVSLAVNLMVLPLLVFHFHGLSLAGLLANTLLVPLVGFSVLPLGLAGLVMLPLQETIALWVFQTGGWFLEVCFTAIRWFSSLSWAYFWVGTVTMPTVAAYYTGLLLAQARQPWRVRGAAMVSLALLTVLLHVFVSGWSKESSPSRLRVNLIDVGQGSSSLVRFPTGETMLVDGGGFYDDSFDIGRGALAPFLWHLGIDRLDHVVLSHDHPDHRNGLKFILSHFRIGAYWETGLTQSNRSMSELAEIAVRRNIPILRMPDIQTARQLGECLVSVLHPSVEIVNRWREGEDLNNSSIVLSIRYGDTIVLLPGDIDRSVEDRLDFNPAPSDRVLLVAAHHGSNRSTGESLLDRARPQAIVFSCGRENLFGFPADSVLARCRQRQIPVFRTDRQGGIEASSDSRQWSLRSLSRHEIDPEPNLSPGGNAAEKSSATVQ